MNRSGWQRVAVNHENASIAAHVSLLLVVAVWGATFALVKDALQFCSPLLFNQVRMLIAAAILLAFNYRTVLQVDRRFLALAGLVGLLLAAGYELQTAGLALTTPSKSTFLTGLVVVIVPLLGFLPGIRDTKAHPVRWPAFMGAAFALGGIVLLTTPKGIPLTESLRSISLGDLLSIACAVAFALHLLVLGRAARSMQVGQVATLQLLFCALAMSLFTPLREHPHMLLTRQLIFAWVVTAVLGTACAFTVQSWSQQYLRPAHTALLLALEPVFATVTSVLFFGEHLSGRTLLGACAILIGLMVSELLGSSKPVAEQPEANLY